MIVDVLKKKDCHPPCALPFTAWCSFGVVVVGPRSMPLQKIHPLLIKIISKGVGLPLHPICPLLLGVVRQGVGLPWAEMSERV